MPRWPLVLDPNRPCKYGHIGERYVSGRCKVCAKKRANKQYHADLIASRNQSKIWRLKNPEKAKQDVKLWKIKNRDRVLAISKKCRESETAKKSMSEWISNNIEKVREIKRQYKKRHPEKDKGRKIAKIKATPSWADKERINEIYVRRDRLSACLGIEFHIDHIVPLRSKYVCGLHVPENLQILPAKINLRKNNKSWPDMTVWS